MEKSLYFLLQNSYSGKLEFILQKGEKIDLNFLVLKDNGIKINLDVIIKTDKPGMGKMNIEVISLGDGEVNITPILQIKGKNIQASHGFKFYSFDFFSEEFFYMQTKGIGKSEIKDLILNSKFEVYKNATKIS